MEPFTHLSQFQVVVCTTCRFAYVSSSAEVHLRKQHPEISKARRCAIANTVQLLPGIRETRDDLIDFPFPPSDSPPIPQLRDPVGNGLRCRHCSFVSVGNKRYMQEHCRTQHRWVNDWKTPGGHIAKRLKVVRDLPWVDGVWCQRLFPSGRASQWFEVGPPSTLPPREPALGDLVVRLHDEQVSRFQNTSALVEVAKQKEEPNPWLLRTGWPVHLQGRDYVQLLALLDPIDASCEPTLAEMWESLDRVFDQARSVSTAQLVGLAVLFEANRKDLAVGHPTRPFSNSLEAKSWQRYKLVWRRVLCYIYRTQSWAEEDRPPYRLTTSQAQALARFASEAAARQPHPAGCTIPPRPSQVSSPPPSPGDQAPLAFKDGERWGATDEFELLGLDLMVRLLDHPFRHTHYESALLSGLAVMGIRPLDGGWVTPLNYTSTYSAIIFGARVLVMYESYREQQAAIDVAVLHGIDKDTAKEEADGLFDIVRPKFQRFMTVVSATSQPSPMDWIFSTRTYGRAIASSIPTDGDVVWQGSQITYGRVSFDAVTQLSDFVSVLVDEARALMARLLMVDDLVETWDDEPLALVPQVDWSLVKDDHSEDSIGYSFLTDDRNTQWVRKGNHWVVRQLVRLESRRAAWLINHPTGVGPDTALGTNPYR